MIWGKTNKERHGKIYRCRRRFAYVPVRLTDGRWLWWQNVWAKEWEHWGRSGVDYYFTIPENKA